MSVTFSSSSLTQAWILKQDQQLLPKSSANTSEYVKECFVQSRFQGRVLDLGGGSGANTLPLIEKGCKVTIIDKDPDAIFEFCLNEFSLFGGLELHYHAMVGDITEKAYPKNMDAIICVDMLPYIPPSKLQVTLDKIYGALHPGGQFVGTLFLLPHKSNVIDGVCIKGAHFCENKELARKIITQSGFKIVKDREYDKDKSFSFLEFLAVKS